MLVLSRKTLQEIVLGDNVRITVLQIRGNTVRLGISAPDEVRIRRGELEPAVIPREHGISRESGIRLADSDRNDAGKTPEQVIPIRHHELNSSPAETETLPRSGPLNRIRQMLVTLRNHESSDS